MGKKKNEETSEVKNEVEEKSTPIVSEVEVNLEYFLDEIRQRDNAGTRAGFEVWYKLIKKQNALDKHPLSYWKQLMQEFLSSEVN